MSEATLQTPTPLTVVLVHGAFADASSWNGVIERLQAAGIQVTAPAEPAARHLDRLRLHRQRSSSRSPGRSSPSATRTAAR